MTGLESPCPSNTSTITPTSTECGTSPKRPRLSIDSTTITSTPANNNNICCTSSSTSVGSIVTSTPTTPSVSCITSANNSMTTTTPSSLVTDNITPNTPNNEDSTHSTNDSDSEMLPVKQEMVELKTCDEFETDAEPFDPEAYLKEGVTLTTSSLEGSGAHSAPPPPPGALRPSYVPPPPIKAQDGEYSTLKKK